MQQRWVHTWGRGASSTGCAFILGLVACSGEAAPDGDLARVHGDLSAASDDAAAAQAANEAALSSGASCDVLLAELQNDLLEQVHLIAEQARLSPDYYYYGGGVFVGEVAPELGAAAPEFGATAPLTSAPAPSAAQPASPFSGFSGTTVQVPGVDEGDFVKAEGDRLYLLHGDSLYVLDARSANATEVVSSIVIEGSPAELFVQNGQVVVTSNYSGPLPGQEEDYYYYYYYPSYTKLTVLDTRGEAISVARETFVEGYSGGSRRHDSVVRTLVQQTSKAQLDYPTVSYVDIFGRPRSQAEIDLQVDLWVLLATESIEDSLVEDYLPSTFERIDGQLVEQSPRCADYLQPGPGLINAGATSIVALDLAAPAAPLGTTTLLGYAESVYANEDVLLIRQTQYGDYTQPIPEVKTNIHRFELDGLATTYTGSGSVAGYIPGTLGLDEVGGVVRAVTSEDQYEIETLDGGVSIIYIGTETRVVTLGVDGGALVALGSSAAFGGQSSVHQARFVDDHAYVFSFGTAGSLQVVDVADPVAPTLAGQTSTNAYTTLVTPFGSDQLLAFADLVDEAGSYLGSGLQIYDVSDPAAPSLASQALFPSEGYSEASYNLHALSVHPERSLLSFPFQRYDTGASTLEVYHVSPAVGIDHVASIVPSVGEPTLLDCLGFMGYPTDPEFLQLLENDPALAESILNECSLYFSTSARRGLFRGDELFLVHTSGVDAYSVYDLSGSPIGGVDLPFGSYYYGSPRLVSPPVAVPAAPSEGAAAPESPAEPATP